MLVRSTKRSEQSLQVSMNDPTTITSECEHDEDVEPDVSFESTPRETQVNESDNSEKEEAEEDMPPPKKQNSQQGGVSS